MIEKEGFRCKCHQIGSKNGLCIVKAWTITAFNPDIPQTAFGTYGSFQPFYTLKHYQGWREADAIAGEPALSGANSRHRSSPDHGGRDEVCAPRAIKKSHKAFWAKGSSITCSPLTRAPFLEMFLVSFSDSFPCNRHLLFSPGCFTHGVHLFLYSALLRFGRSFQLCPNLLL